MLTSDLEDPDRPHGKSGQHVNYLVNASTGKTQLVPSGQLVEDGIPLGGPAMKDDAVAEAVASMPAATAQNPGRDSASPGLFLEWQARGIDVTLDQKRDLELMIGDEISEKMRMTVMPVMPQTLGPPGWNHKAEHQSGFDPLSPDHTHQLSFLGKRLTPRLGKKVTGTRPPTRPATKATETSAYGIFASDTGDGGHDREYPEYDAEDCFGGEAGMEWLRVWL
ncbi:hypothetical protein BU16DRAFT_621802 [Lophium mytilinum]|uniref:Uncharacterized protein n=1 Tax=Lophium mytilinum TaxID=390894 RepID=A0A6A6QGI6_9PEZI|nr:hypothetical protein BU16DRAFT_621802 [Lophium mytilinum]